MPVTDEIEGVLIDLDGTIWKGNQLIPHADEAIAHLRSLGKRIVFVSNRGNWSRRMCYEQLTRFGMAVTEEEIILSSTVTAQFLREHYPLCQVWTLGDKGLREELRLHQVRLAAVPEEADFLVITLHETMTYQDLNLAFRAVSHGARIMATNIDKTFPNEHGNAIDVAGMVGAIEAATGRKVEFVFGKPTCFMAEAALRQLQVPPNRCLIIGDSVESDIRMGRMHGMRTALVLTGNTKPSQLDALRAKERPDYVLDSIGDIIRLGKEIMQ
ncbi:MULTISPECIES: HAD-IIA family hydrolase [Geobacillus]|jgi:arabinose operon protein AraL|uniref:Acid sugar phosphatase n=2 Tax=Geobacillus thermodenitrificans TaxID=33940 RepID=A4IP95_GEOTN|nr:HAD-IIA family hydrolase [Geobacillus sp. MR]ABO67149.1 AraL protein [Geobacillus thermodenitrificans NG80-2]ATO35825.1 haloacid dehalogenase [Geobacillus thermodenitrificans]OQP08301.1 haloacid dehalogenase [Geobacillus sp. 47C-IIb]QNU31494.1 HAD-IIA family hydrolase [Geobacillus sp. 47C-IIb]